MAHLNPLDFSTLWVAFGFHHFQAAYSLQYKELRAIRRWLDANRLSLNIDKTNYIIFHSSSRNISSDSTIK